MLAGMKRIIAFVSSLTEDLLKSGTPKGVSPPTYPETLKVLKTRGSYREQGNKCCVMADTALLTHVR
jgi:hypothetical protein